MNTNDIPDFEDRAIGQALLTILFFIEVIWIFTPSISPLKLPTSANNIGNIVSHLEVFLIVVIPMAILGLVSTLFPKTRVKTRASGAIDRLNTRVVVYRKTRNQKGYKRDVTYKSE